MQQLTAVFQESVSYKSKKLFQTEKATVLLSINYSEKTFSITPCYGKDKFEFNQCKHPDKWKAVCDAIRSATEFAENELFGPKEMPAQ
jgi:hypothetical protein